jgi:hypothetical protein
MPHYITALNMSEQELTVVRQPDLSEKNDDEKLTVDEVVNETEKKNETEQYKIFQERLKNAFVSNEDYHLFNKLPLTDKQKVELVLDMLVKEGTSTSDEVVCDGDVCRLVKKT